MISGKVRNRTIIILYGLDKYKDMIKASIVLSEEIQGKDANGKRVVQDHRTTIGKLSVPTSIWKPIAGIFSIGLNFTTGYALKWMEVDDVNNLSDIED